MFYFLAGLCRFLIDVILDDALGESTGRDFFRASLPSGILRKLGPRKMSSSDLLNFLDNMLGIYLCDYCDDKTKSKINR